MLLGSVIARLRAPLPPPVHPRVLQPPHRCKGRSQCDAHPFRGFQCPSHDRLLAIDVEYVHMKREECLRGQRTAYAAEVCLVDSKLDVVYHSYIRPSSLQHKQDRRGGVPWANVCDAPEPETVREHLSAILQGKCLIGLGMWGDLKALGLDVALIENRLDLMCLSVFCKKNDGSACSLKSLAADLLGRRIQSSGGHSALEDATAMMELYLRFAHTSPDCPPGILQAHFHQQMCQELDAALPSQRTGGRLL